MRGKVILLVTILLASTTLSTYSQELKSNANKAQTSIGNMPKNIQEAGDIGKYTTVKLDGLNNPHIAYYDADNGEFIVHKI